MKKPIRRANVRDLAAEQIRSMIVEGKLQDGTRINEVHLAERLGVSRPPLREALNQLVVERALKAVPGKGFFVRPLSLAEFEQLYGIRPILDPEALRLAGIPSPRHLDRLIKLNEKLGRAKTPTATIDLDDRWHLELVADCPNRILVDLIKSFMRQTRRYELAVMRERRQVFRATRDHDRILQALAVGDLDTACSALRHNMGNELELAPVVAWLRERENIDPGPRKES